MYSIYKPNKTATGSLFTFNVSKGSNDKASALYVSAVKQASWSNGRGSFRENARNPEKTITVKFNQTEMGELKLAFRTYLSLHVDNKLSFFHRNGDTDTRIYLSRYEVGDKKGYKLAINRNSNTFVIGLTLGEGEVLHDLLGDGIKQILDEAKEEDQKNRQRAIASRQGQRSNVDLDIEEEETSDDDDDFDVPF